MKLRVFTVCVLILIFANWICAQMPAGGSRSLTSTNRNIFPFRKKLTKEQKKLLQPKSEDLMRHAGFLQQPNTGIFRLLPDPGCEENPLVIRADEKCLQAIPESSFYSFREKEHTAVILSDIRLNNNHLITDGILAQGILVKLGDIALESISLKSEGLGYINSYSPLSSSIEAQKQYNQIARGVKAGRYEYKKALPAVENMTYALRVIAYKGGIYRKFRGYRYNLLEGDKRIDLTLAFRVVRKEADGAVTLLWKELQRRESPKIKFPNKKN